MYRVVQFTGVMPSTYIVGMIIPEPSWGQFGIWEPSQSRHASGWSLGGKQKTKCAQHALYVCVVGVALLQTALHSQALTSEIKPEDKL